MSVVAATSLNSSRLYAEGNINLNTFVNTTTSSDVSVWLSEIARVNQYAIHQETVEKITPGTCSWILEDPRFCDWKHRGSGVFWGVGMPGAGKTILSSFIIKHLRQQAITRDDQSYVAFAYIRYNDRLSTTEILAAILQQLSNQSELIRDHVRQTLYKSCKGENRQPGQSELVATLRASMERVSKVFIVLDALDELGESFREGIMKIIASSNEPVLITSRELHLDCLDHPSVEIRVPDRDFEVFVKAEIEKLPKLRSLLQNKQDVLGDVTASMIQKSDGMMLLCALQLGCLASVTTVRSLKASVGRLPTTLNDMYGLTVNRILAQSEEESQLALKAFFWVAHAARPLQVSELLAVLAMEPDSDDFNEDAITTEGTLLSVCNGLISINSGSGVRFIHNTTHDFFSSYSGKLYDDPHTFIADCCATYWKLKCAFHHGENIRPSICECHPFAIYTHGYLGLHTSRSMRLHNGSLSCHIRTLLLQSSILPNVRISLGNGFCHMTVSCCNFHFAAYWGLHSFLKDGLSGQNTDLSKKNSKFEACCQASHNCTLLMTACVKGHLETVELLLQIFKTDLNIMKQFDTALTLSIYSGSVELVQTLLEAGASVRVGDPLVCASRHGDSRIAELLLAHPDIEINSQNVLYSGATALHQAAKGGHTSLVNLLLSQPGIDVNLPTYHWQPETPLSAATREGHPLVVQMLLEAPGINPTCSQSPGLCYLAMGERSGELLPIIRMFLEIPDFDFNETIRNGLNVLHLCARKCKLVDPLRVLLASSRVDANHQDGYGWTPLHVASYCGAEVCVQALLDSGDGLDLNAQCLAQSDEIMNSRLNDWQRREPLESRPEDTTGPYVTALDLARGKGCERIAQVLEKYGAKCAAEVKV